MPSPSESLAELIRRFVDDRDALDEHEYADLTAAVQASPELAAQLRDQLVLDDLLSQRLAIDRRRFDAQVQQRVADHVRGELELNTQADDLRSLALARLDAPRDGRGSWSTWISLSLAMSLLGILATGAFLWQQYKVGSLVATVESVEGTVIVRRVPSDNDQYAAADLVLRLGDRLLVPADAAVVLRWSDDTRVTISGESDVSLPVTNTSKRVSLELGELTASVARQASGQPMIFATPHADAIVRGTELRLRVIANETRLNVTEGKVELVEHTSRDSQLVAAAESAVASPGEKIALEAVRFPASQQGLSYLVSAGQQLVRRTGRLSPTELVVAADSAAISESGELQLGGGYLIDTQAAEMVAAQLRESDESTWEIVLGADEPPDARLRTIVAIESEQGTIVALVQQNDQLFLAQNATRPLSELPPDGLLPVGALPEFGKRTHVLVAFRRSTGDYVVQFDGEESARGVAPGITAFSHAGTRLTIGGAGDNTSPRWHGTISGLAIYDRWLVP